MKGRWIEVGPADRARFGAKGVVLAELRRLGHPVPPAFTIARDAAPLLAGGIVPKELKREIEDAVAELNRASDRAFGDLERPMLLSVRPGSSASMPGVLGTILNVGASEVMLPGLAASSDRRFALDCRARFLRSFGESVLGLSSESAHASPFLAALDRARAGSHGPVIKSSVPALESLIQEYQQIIHDRSGRMVPEDPWQQLFDSVVAAFSSWRSPRAQEFRAAQRIPASLGSAVTVCQMVFGNFDDRSASGILFTRDPNTGAAHPYGEYLRQAQGEDVASGGVTPRPLNAESSLTQGQETLQQILPEAYQELVERGSSLERALGGPQEIEFTIEHERLWLLQSRPAKLSPRAAVQTAVSLAEQGRLSAQEAVTLVEPLALRAVLLPSLEAAQDNQQVELTRGVPAAPGIVSGKAVLSCREAEDRARRGEDVILVRLQTSPEEIQGIRHAKGVITVRGGTTSHAAVVARALGKVCVVGAHEIRIDLPGRRFGARGVFISEGEEITVDGRTGVILLGIAETRRSTTLPEVERLLQIADQVRRAEVRALLTAKEDARLALDDGAAGFLIDLQADPTLDLASLAALSKGRLVSLRMPAQPPALDARILSPALETARNQGVPLELIFDAQDPSLKERFGHARDRFGQPGAPELGLWARSPDELAAFHDLAPLARTVYLPGESVGDLEQAPGELAALEAGLTNLVVATAREIKLALVGARAAEEATIRWAEQLGFSALVVPPRRVKEARLAAARAASPD